MVSCIILTISVLTMVELGIRSQNVRGIADATKRRQVFYWLHNKPEEIIFLQEAHCTPDAEALWRTEWGGDIFFAHGTRNSRGVCILFKNKITKKIHNSQSDPNGRYIILDVEVNDKRLTLVNIYGPNNDDAEFYLNLMEKVEDIPNDNRIIAGDFNVVLDLDIDKKGGAPTTNINAQKVLKLWMEETDLVDIWRFKHQTEYKYTWFRRRPSLICCRLDYFLVSFGMVDFVAKADINYGFKSDHSSINLRLNLSSHKRGKGFWKFNCSLLYDQDFVKTIKDTIANTAADNEGANSNLLWDTIKCSVRGECIKYSTSRKRNKLNRITEMEKKINQLENDYKKHQNTQIEDELNTTKLELQKLIEYKTLGAIIRSRTKWYEEGEKNTKYFLKLEQRNANNKVINRLDLPDGTTTSDPNKILNAQKLFYEKLYKSKQNQAEDTVFDDLNLPKIPAQIKENIQHPITEAEILKNLKAMANNKSPGEDGFPAEFFKFFWQDIKKYLINSYQYSYTNGSLSLTQKRGIICLIPKKDKDPLQLKNWRPLTLLNFDYKLIAKLISERFKLCITNIVHTDQTGFIKGRYIGENIARVLDIIYYAQEADIPALLISIDFEKAYDMLEWSFILKSLKQFEFPDYMINWFKVLYKDVCSCVTNNGCASSYFSLSRGVRQGCPLSPYLFIVCAEILAHLIRVNKHIKGIKIGHQTHKISQYADDTVILSMFCEESVNEIVNTFDKFNCSSGLRVNYDKTEIMRIGSLRYSDVKIITRRSIKWSQDPITLLGIKISTFLDTIPELNFTPLISKIGDIIKSWNWRKLTLFGRVTLINSLLASQLIYRLSVLPTPSKNLLNIVDKTLFKYLWNNKSHRISKHTVTKGYSEGGLKMVDIFVKEVSLKIAWIKRILLSDYTFCPTLEAYSKIEFATLVKCNLSPKDSDSYWYKDPAPLWRNVLRSWCEFNFVKSENIKNPLEEIIWFNSNIRISDKIVFYKELYSKGILKVRDLLQNNTKFMTFAEFQTKFDTKLNYLQYHGLVHAIRNTWKNILADKNVNSALSEIQTDPLAKEKISKYVYNHMISSKECDLTKQCKYWTETLKVNVDRDILSMYFIELYKSTVYTKLRAFQYRVLHNILVTNYDLCKWGIKESNLCTFCKTEVETSHHLLLECKISKTVWEWTFQFIHDKAGIKITYSNCDLILGVLECDDSSLFNLLFTLTKQYIYACRCLEIVPNKEVLFEKIEEVRCIEKKIALSNNNVRQYNYKWDILE